MTRSLFCAFVSYKPESIARRTAKGESGTPEPDTERDGEAVEVGQPDAG